jgi:NAD-dependent dihydropyrimidine dehydrogenase PreA subunit
VSRSEPSTYRQIRVGQMMTGMSGLDEVFAALHAEGFGPDETVVPELLARTRRRNYIAPGAEPQYAEALLREFQQFCRQREAGCVCTVAYGTWRGHPRETIPWYPTIRAELCDGCGACLRFCAFGVLAASDDGKVEVVEPFKCQVGCSACTQICKPEAIAFPPREVLEPFGG